MAPKFPLGQVIITRNALDVLYPADVFDCLQRYVQGDWGDLCLDDKKENELSLRAGFRLLSADEDRENYKKWLASDGAKGSVPTWVVQI